MGVTLDPPPDWLALRRAGPGVGDVERHCQKGSARAAGKRRLTGTGRLSHV